MMNTQEPVLEVGTLLEGDRAVELGLIDEVGGLGTAMDRLYEMIENSEKRYADPGPQCGTQAMEDKNG
jgi:ClpP class serine protease